MPQPSSIFSSVAAGWRAYDIATFLLEEPDEIVEAFVDGYQVVRPLTDEEMTAIPLFQVVQNIWVLGIRASYVNEWAAPISRTAS